MSPSGPPELRDLREAWELIRGGVAGFADGETPAATPAEGPDPYGNPDPEWMRIDWREHLAFADVHGAPVNYVEMGPPEGAPRGLDLVLVHGLAGCWQNWLETIPALATRHRVLALDLPGAGHSPLPPWEISIPAYGRAVSEFCDATGVREAAIVGHSLGGFVAAEAVCANPGRFDKLGLIAAAGISHSRMRPEPAALAGRLAVGLAPLALNFQDRALRRPGLRQSAFRSVFHRPGELRPELLWEIHHNGAGRPGFLAAMTTLMGYDFTDRLGDVETETLIVWGRDDLINPPADSVEYGRLLRNSSTVILDGTGHCPQLERPVRFNRLLEAFLER